MKKFITILLLLFISVNVLSQKRQKIYGYEIMGISQLYLSDERTPDEFNITPINEGKVWINLTDETILIDVSDTNINFNIIEVYGRDRMEILFICIDDENKRYEIRMKETSYDIFLIVDDGEYYRFFSLEED